MGDTIAKAVPLITASATAIGSAASGYASLKSNKEPKAPKMPVLTAVAEAPTQDDAAIQRAKLDAIRRRQASSGRSSTMLVDDETLG